MSETLRTWARSPAGPPKTEERLVESVNTVSYEIDGTGLEYPAVEIERLVTSPVLPMLY